MKSFRMQRSASADPAMRNRTAQVVSARERMEAYNQSYNRKSSSRSKSNSRTGRTSYKRNATSNSTSQPLRPYSKYAAANNTNNRRTTKVTHHQRRSSRAKSNRNTARHSRGLEFQETYVQHTANHNEPTRNYKQCSRQILSRKSSRDFQKTKSSRQVSMGDESYSDVQSRLSQYKAAMGNSYRSDPSYLVPLLALRAYHIPGNSWFQDWRQFMCNNHPLFGICMHHKLHPIKSCTRMIALLGSILFGLVMTNIFDFFYIWNPEFNQNVISITLESGDVYTLTTGMLLLWTLGAGVHASFNLSVWYIAACSCCRAGGCCESRACCPSFGKHLIRGVVVMIAIMTVIVILMRFAIGNDGVDTLDGSATNGNATDSSAVDYFFTEEAWDFTVDVTEGFNFVYAWMVELGLSFFVYYPFFATVLMSGVLGCKGKLPVLGGRPYEVAQYQRKLQRMSKLSNWEMSGSPTYLDSQGSEDEFAQNFSFVSDDRESAHEDDIEIVWTPTAKRQFERRWSS